MIIDMKTLKITSSTAKIRFQELRIVFGLSLKYRANRDDWNDSFGNEENAESKLDEHKNEYDKIPWTIHAVHLKNKTRLALGFSVTQKNQTLVRFSDLLSSSR